MSNLSRWPILLLLCIPLLSSSAMDKAGSAEWQDLCQSDVPSDEPAAMSRRAASCELAGRPEDARRDYLTAIGLAAKAYGKNHPLTQSYRLRLQLLQQPGS